MSWKVFVIRRVPVCGQRRGLISVGSGRGGPRPAGFPMPPGWLRAQKNRRQRSGIGPPGLRAACRTSVSGVAGRPIAGPRSGSRCPTVAFGHSRLVPSDRQGTEGVDFQRSRLGCEAGSPHLRLNRARLSGACRFIVQRKRWSGGGLRQPPGVEPCEVAGEVGGVEGRLEEAADRVGGTGSGARREPRRRTGRCGSARRSWRRPPGRTASGPSARPAHRARRSVRHPAVSRPERRSG